MLGGVGRDAGGLEGVVYKIEYIVYSTGIVCRGNPKIKRVKRFTVFTDNNFSADVRLDRSDNSSARSAKEVMQLMYSFTKPHEASSRPHTPSSQIPHAPRKPPPHDRRIHSHPPRSCPSEGDVDAHSRYTSPKSLQRSLKDPQVRIPAPGTL